MTISIDENNDTQANASGGASAILDKPAEAPAAATAASAADTPPADVVPADWMKGLTQDADALKWLGNKAFPDPGKLVDAFRETERAFRTAIPSENDPKERWDAFYKRMGRPDEPTGYEIKAPDGFEADQAVTDGFRKVLFENGIPPKAAAELVDWYNGVALSGIDTQASAVKAQQAALRSEWGADYGAKVEVARRGMELLDLDSKSIDAMSSGFGVDKTLKLLEKIGRMTSEDMVRGNNGRSPGFTVDPTSAQQQVDAFVQNREKVAALRKGDAAAKAEWDRLNGQLAGARDASKKRAG